MKTKTSHFLFSRLSIQQRLPLLISILLLVSVIIYGFANYYSLKKATLIIGTERLSSFVTELASSLGSSAQVLTKTANATAAQETVVGYLNTDGKKFGKETIEALDKLHRDSNWVSVQLLNNNLVPVLRSNKSTANLNINIKDVISYTKAGPDSTKIGKIYNIKGIAYHPVITAIASQKHIIGYIICWIRIHQTPKSLAQFYKLVGMSGNIYIVNTDGSLWTNLIDPLPHAPLELKKPYQLMKFTDPDGKKMIASAHAIPNTYWIVVVAFSEENILTGVTSFVNWIILIGIVLIAIGAFAAWVMSRNITKPLNQLMAAAAAISEGDYSLPLPIDDHQTDELGKLANAFNMMRSQIYEMLQGLETKVSERTAELEEEIRLRKITEESLSISSKRYHQLVEEVKDYAIIMLDPDGNVLSWNKGAEQIKGYTEEEIFGKSFTCFYSEDDVKNNKPQKNLEKAAQTGRSEDEGWRVRKDGSKFWANIVYTTIYNDDHKLLGFAKITRDITARRKLEEERRIIGLKLEERIKEVAAQALQLETVNKELEAFSYSVSHDLRTPLRAISGYSIMLKEDYEPRLDNEGLRIIRNIITNAKMMGQLIDDLLSFSRLGKKELICDQIDMEFLATNVVNELLQAESEDKYHFTVGPLPPVKADQVMMKQVLLNLLSNSIKYTSKKPDPEIEIGSMDKETETIYYVKDNGAGFDMAYADKLFGVFQRLHSQEEFEGSGVGLALVKRIIKKHHGRVWAEGIENEGATFYFSLPKT